MAENQSQPSADAAKKAAEEKAAKDKAAADAAAKANPKAGEQEAARQKVRDAEKALAEAKAELEKVGVTAETSAEDDAKRAAAAGAGKTAVASGRAGGIFNIDGEGFGSDGTVMMNGRVLEVTRWADHSIKGRLPADIGSGEMVIKTGGAEIKAPWPPPAPKQTGPTDRTVMGQPSPTK